MESWIESNWATLRHKRLNELILPGTHDTGAYTLQSVCLSRKASDVCQYIASIWSSGVVKAWTLTQDKSILQQLLSGVRFLDLRMSYCSLRQSLYLSHTFVGVDYLTALQDISTFLSQFPCEIVVARICCDWDHRCDMTPDAVALALQQLKDFLGQHIYDKRNQITEDLYPTLAQMVSEGTRLALFMELPVTKAGASLGKQGQVQRASAASPHIQSAAPSNNFSTSTPSAGHICAHAKSMDQHGHVLTQGTIMDSASMLHSQEQLSGRGSYTPCKAMHASGHVAPQAAAAAPAGQVHGAPHGAANAAMHGDPDPSSPWDILDKAWVGPCCCQPFWANSPTPEGTLEGLLQQIAASQSDAHPVGFKQVRHQAKAATAATTTNTKASTTSAQTPSIKVTADAAGTTTAAAHTAPTTSTSSAPVDPALHHPSPNPTSSAPLRFAAMAVTPNVSSIITGTAASCIHPSMGLRTLADQLNALLPKLLEVDLTGVMAISLDFPSQQCIEAIIQRNLTQG